MKEGRLTTRCGTPSYCAPELLSGAGYGKAVDVWSLGVLAYVVLTGVLPFVGADRAELFRKIQKGAYDFASVRVPISALARDLIWRLLRLVPMERYSTRETLQARSRETCIGTRPRSRQPPEALTLSPRAAPVADRRR